MKSKSLNDLVHDAKTWLIHKLGGKTMLEYVSAFAIPHWDDEGMYVTLEASKEYRYPETFEDTSFVEAMRKESLYYDIATKMRECEVGQFTVTTDPEDPNVEEIKLEVRVYVGTVH